MLEDRRIKEPNFPFTWKRVDHVCTLVMDFHDVEFIEDYGPIKKGDTFPLMSVDYSRGVIEVLADNSDDEVDDVQVIATLHIHYVPDGLWTKVL